MWETLNLGTGENTTKAVVRQKVWEYMEKNDIANFPRPVYHRIPNFKGAQIAGKPIVAKHVRRIRIKKAYNNGIIPS